MKKTNTVQWINGILFFRLICTFVVLTSVTLIVYLHPQTGFLKGVSDAILSKIQLAELYTNPSSGIAHLLGYMMLPTILMILELLFLNRQKRIPFWIIMVLDLLFGLAKPKILLFPLIIFILSLMRPTRLFLTRSNSLLDDRNVPE